MRLLRSMPAKQLTWTSVRDQAVARKVHSIFLYLALLLSLVPCWYRVATTLVTLYPVSQEMIGPGH